MEEYVQDIKEDVRALQERVNQLEKSEGVAHIQLENSLKLIEKNNSLLDSLNDTIHETQIAMTEVTQKIGQMNNSIVTLRSDVRELQEERNLNIVSWVKSNWVSLCTAIAFVFYMLTQK